MVTGAVKPVFLPVLILLPVPGVMQVSYTLECMRLSKRKNI